MLPSAHIKSHAKYAVYSHLLSCFAILIISSLLPAIVSNYVTSRLFQDVKITVDQLTSYIEGTLDSSSEVYGNITVFLKEYGIAQLIILFTNLINMPFQYLAMRYFLVLAGTPADKTCSFRAFFSGMEKPGALVKGAVIVLISGILSVFGIVVGYFPVYLAFCMAPFYLALSPETGVFEALSKSRKLMKRHKMEAFMILLEFIVFILGAYLLSFAGMGIIAIFVEIMAKALLNTTLAVIFVRLDKGNFEEPCEAE